MRSLKVFSVIGIIFMTAFLISYLIFKHPTDLVSIAGFCVSAGVTITSLYLRKEDTKALAPN